APVISTTLFFRSSITGAPPERLRRYATSNEMLLSLGLWSSRQKYGGTRRLACFQVAMRLRSILQSVGLVYFDFDLAGLHDIEQFLGASFQVLAAGGINHQR